MSLRDERDALAAVDGPDGTARCRALSDLVDAWVIGLFEGAAAGVTGLALAATGGYGR